MKVCFVAILSQNNTHLGVGSLFKKCVPEKNSTLASVALQKW